MSAAWGSVRKTGYKTLRRYAESGANGLQDRSHARTRVRTARAGRWRTACIALRLDASGQGCPCAAQNVAEPRGHQRAAKSTIQAILKRIWRSLMKRTSAKHTPQVRFEYPDPNALLAAGLQRAFRHAARPLPSAHSPSDASFYASTSLSKPVPTSQGATVQDRLTTVFRRYGLPQAMSHGYTAPPGATTPDSPTRPSPWLGSCTWADLNRTATAAPNASAQTLG